MEKTKEKKQSISIPAIIAGTAIGFLVLVVFVLISVLYYVSSTASNLSAALGYRFVYEYEWGGEQRSIDVDPGGAIETEYEWGGEQRNVDVNTGTGGTQIEGDYEWGGQQRSIDVDSGADGTQFETEYEWGGQRRSVEIFNDSGSVIQLPGNSENLSVEVNNLSTGARRAIIDLEGNSILLINNSDDVKAYGNLVAEEKPGIQRVRIENTGVNITYRQPAKFLGFVPVRIRATVEVNNQNQVRIRLPWYHLFFVKDVEPVRATVQSRIYQEATTGSNTRVLINPGGVSQPTIQAREAAWRIDVVSDVVGDRTLNLQGDGNNFQFETEYEWGGEQRGVEINATPGGQDIEIWR